MSRKSVCTIQHNTHVILVSLCINLACLSCRNNVPTQEVGTSTSGFPAYVFVPTQVTAAICLPPGRANTKDETSYLYETLATCPPDKLLGLVNDTLEGHGWHRAVDCVDCWGPPLNAAGWIPVKEEKDSTVIHTQWWIHEEGATLLVQIGCTTVQVHEDSSATVTYTYCSGETARTRLDRYAKKHGLPWK